MKLFFHFGVKHALAAAVLAGLSCGAAHAQDPIVVATTAVAVIEAVKPKKQSPFPKFEGTVMNSNNVLITVRSKENELAVRTFTLTEEASSKMQKLIDKGGYQYGDKVTVLYEPASQRAVKIKGKPSKAL